MGIILVITMALFSSQIAMISHNLISNKVQGEQKVSGGIERIVNVTTQRHDKSRRRRKAYICITGQLSRLELQNKINRLINRLNSYGFDMYIGLAMAEGAHRFSNDDSGGRLILKRSIKEVKDELNSLSGVLDVRHFPPSFEDIQFNPKYDKILGNYTVKVNKTLIHKNYLKNQAELALNNARQFKTLQYCNKWPNLEKEVDIIVRVREDVLIQHFYTRQVLYYVMRGAVVTSSCDQWYGINDKIAFAPSTKASDFFNVPYEEYLKFDNSKYNVEKLNAEQLYKISYNNHGFALRSTPMLVVTKVVTKLKDDSLSSESKNCTILGNPFQLKYTKNCPRHPRGVGYEAPCWKSF